MLGSQNSKANVAPAVAKPSLIEQVLQTFLDLNNNTRGLPASAQSLLLRSTAHRLYYLG